MRIFVRFYNYFPCEIYKYGKSEYRYLSRGPKLFIMSVSHWSKVGGSSCLHSFIILFKIIFVISRFAVCTVGYLNILPYFRNLKVLVLHWCLWGTSFVTCLYLAKWLRGYVTRHLFVFYFFFKFKERIPKFFLSSIFSLGWALPTQCISQAQYFFYSFFYNLFIFKICNYIFFFQSEASKYVLVTQ